MGNKEEKVLTGNQEEVKTSKSEETKESRENKPETLTRLQTLERDREESRKKIYDAVEIINSSEDLDETKAYLAIINEEVPKHNTKCAEIYLEKKACSGKSALDIMHDIVINQTYETLSVGQNKELGTQEIKAVTQFMSAENVHAKVKGGIGADKNWVFYAHKLNYLVAVRLAKACMEDEKEREKIATSYEMKDAVRAVLFPDKIDPLKDIDHKKEIISNKNVLAALKYVIAAMLGEEYKPMVTSYHANYILNAYAEHDKKNLGGGLKIRKDKQFTRLLMDVCYLIKEHKTCKISGGNLKSK